MQPQDIAVGAVSIGLGLLLLVGAIGNVPWLMQLRKVRALSGAVGSPAARVLVGLVGAGTIALGVAIAVGWRVNW